MFIPSSLNKSRETTNSIPNLVYLKNGQNSIHFVNFFKSLGSIISFDLTEDAEIQACMSKASGCFHLVFRNRDIDKRIKYWLYIMGPINALLWGCKSWNLNGCSQIKLRAFHHSAIRCILGIGMGRVIEQHTTNESVRFDFKCTPPLTSS